MRANDIDLSTMEDVQFNTKPSECGGCIDVSVSCVMREDGEEMNVHALLARVRKMDVQALIEAIQEGMMPKGVIPGPNVITTEGANLKSSAQTSMFIGFGVERRHHHCPTPGCIAEPGAIIPTHSKVSDAYTAGWNILEGDWYCPECSKFAGLTDEDEISKEDLKNFETFGQICVTKGIKSGVKHLKSEFESISKDHPEVRFSPDEVVEMIGEYQKGLEEDGSQMTVK